mgnify:FL=1
MKEIAAIEIPVLDLDGDKRGIVMKYYKYGMWHFRAVIFVENGILSGIFYSLENAKQFVMEKSNV